MIVFGEHFDVEDREAGQILRSPLKQAEKMSTLLDELLARLDDRAAARKAAFDAEEG